MLSQLLPKNKENIIKVESGFKETQGLLHNAVSILKEQIVSLKQQKVSMKKEWVREVEQLTLQINQYKKKLEMVTDKYLLQTFTKDREAAVPPKDYQKLLREKQFLIEQERQNKKKLEQKLSLSAQQSIRHQKQCQQLRLQKEKSMEISLLQKIDLEQKCKLLEEEVNSKKNIIRNLKKQLEKNYSERESLNKQERSIVQKSKELECFSKEVSEYNRLNELRMRQQVSQLTKQNLFLKQYVKKIERLAKKECECDAKDEKIRQNLYQIKRQLALAKVKLGENYFNQTHKKKHISSQSSDSESNYSFEQKRK